LSDCAFIQPGKEVEFRFGALLLNHVSEHGRGMSNERPLAFSLVCPLLVVLSYEFVSRQLASPKIGDLVLPKLVLGRLYSSELRYRSKSL
jgi:hypothetical protein